MAEENRKEAIVDIHDKSDMLTQAKLQAKLAVEKKQVESLVSKHMKDYFDQTYGPNWHCIVGKNFHSSVNYENKHFMFFYEGPIAILLYKMG